MAEAQKRPLLRAAADAALTSEQQEKAKRFRWIDRGVSLWAPVTVLAAVTGFYIIVVETAVCTYPMLQPVMQGLGLVSFAWWAVLVVGRFIPGELERARMARYRADEVLGEVVRVADKHRAELKDKAWDELVSATVAVLRGVGGPSSDLTAAIATLEQVSEKHLAKFNGAGWLDFGSGFVRALFVALAFRAVLIEPYKIPSGSMIPTLEIGDQIFVNKFIYGVRLPFTNYVPFVLVRPPKRGDVIVFNNPFDTRLDFVKRVVGVPGDKLEFTEHGVVVNGTELSRALETQDYGYWNQPSPRFDESFSEMWSRWFRDDWNHRNETLFRENIDGRQHYLLDNPDNALAALSRTMDRMVVVPDGHVFVMGDNRNNSDDSRFGLGDGTDHARFVPYGNIKGKATIIWLSLAHGGFGSKLFGGTGIRYDRFFQPVTLCGNEAPKAGAPPEAL